MLTTKEAAQIANCSPITIRSAIFRGVLKAEHPSPRVTLIQRRDLNRWMQNHQNQRGPKPKGSK